MMRNSCFLPIFILLTPLLSAQTTLPPEMVFVEGGTFTMGCTPEQVPDCNWNESPTRFVRMHSFYIGKYETTLGQWQSLMNDHSWWANSDLPLGNVSWYSFATFCNRLSVQNSLEPVYYSDAGYSIAFDSIVDDSLIYTNIWFKTSANGYRMPTEAEWEFAARGGILGGAPNKFSGSNNSNFVSWNITNSGDSKHPIGQKLPNELGLYDMSGNTSEFCFDIRAKYDNSTWMNCNEPRKLTHRGGDYHNPESWSRVAFRNHWFPGAGSAWNFGFRLARNVD